LYQFGAFRLDPAKRILLHENQSVALTPKGLEILLLLIQNRDRVVPKEELISRLWPDTFVDEANLSQNLFVLRKALGESAQDQRYIVTVRGTGYRFAEDVQEIRETETGKVELEPSKQSGSGLKKAKLTPDSLRHLWAIVIAMVLIVAIAATLHFRRNNPTPSPAGNATIVLADFENRTGDPVFDDTFSQALLIELEQSPFLKILSTERVNGTLRRMNLQPGSRLTRPIAMEVCEREDATAVLAGSISAVGKQYLLAIEAFACRDGSLLASELNRSESKEGTLDALSRNASEIRLKLGESLH
jgi:DNA-binding winged helix-turn-helix (wHTH) protein